MVRVTEADAREHLGDLIRDVAAGQEAVLIERDGESQAVVISFDEYTRLRARTQESGSQDWKGRVDRLQERISREMGKGSLPPAEEVIRKMREERDEQILGNLR
ncbi:MAG TPA: type II toxin-antitoxin system Phd/YefM family antitoxin [Thermoanaerobaculia bacterium]|jgi:prevent-host-death family protein